MKPALKILAATFILTTILPTGCRPVDTSTVPNFPSALTDRQPTPQLFQQETAQVPWLFLIGTIGIAVGVALLVWLPVDEKLGLAIAAGSAVLLLTAATTKAILTHPAIVYATAAAGIFGIGYWLYRTYIKPSTPPATKPPA